MAKVNALAVVRSSPVVTRWQNVRQHVVDAFASRFLWTARGRYEAPIWLAAFDAAECEILGDWLEDQGHPLTTEWREALAGVVEAMKQPC